MDEPGPEAVSFTGTLGPASWAIAPQPATALRAERSFGRSGDHQADTLAAEQIGSGAEPVSGDITECSCSLQF